jgi:predicted transcriptional regulator
MIYSIAGVLGRLANEPGEAVRREMNATERAEAFVRCLAADVTEVDHLARALLSQLEHHPTRTFLALPAMPLLRQYFTCTLSLPARSDIDSQVHAWLSSLPPPKSGVFLYREHLGLDGQEAKESGLTGRKRGREEGEEGGEEEEEEEYESGTGDDYSTSEGAAAASTQPPRRAMKAPDPITPPASKYLRHPNQYPVKPTGSAESAAPPTKPRQPNQYTVKRALEGSEQPAPKPRQPNQYTVKRAEGSEQQPAPKPRQPNQYTVKSSEKSDASAPAHKYPRQPNQYAIKATDKAVVLKLGGVVKQLPQTVMLHPGRHPDGSRRESQASKPPHTARPSVLPSSTTKPSTTKPHPSRASAAADKPAVKSSRPRAPREESDSDSDASSRSRKPTQRKSTGGGATVENIERVRSAVKKQSEAAGAAAAGGGGGSGKKHYIPRDNGQQIGPFSTYRVGAYTPAVFLESSMRCCLRRIAFVLHRDGLTRRQVARLIGVSQSKMSRLLHGRSPFRNSAEEFHLRHFLYQQEKKFVGRVKELIERRTDKRGIIDFARLPSPLSSISPSSSFVLYLHFLLPLDSRSSIDLLAGRALGENVDEWRLNQDEQEELQGEGQSEPTIEQLAEAKMDVDEKIDAAKQGPVKNDAESRSARSESAKKDLESKTPDDSDEMTLEASLPSVSGLDAWSRVPPEHLRVRIASLVATTSSSQTSLARYLGVSSAAVSMFLRGVRKTVQDAWVHRLEKLGLATDRVLVGKTAAVMAEPREQQRDEEGEEDVVPNGADRRYALLVGLSEAEIDAAVAEASDVDQLHAVKLQELVSILLKAGIPMETEADAHTAIDGTVHPLSLRSWLQFTCSFLARSRVDALVIPWLDRWDVATGNQEEVLPVQKDIVQAFRQFEELVEGEWMDCSEPRLLEDDAFRPVKKEPMEIQAPSHNEVQPTVKQHAEFAPAPDPSGHTPMDIDAGSAS